VADQQGARTPSKKALTALYMVLAVVTAAVCVFAFGEGDDKRAQPLIAGGYDAAEPNACLGRTSKPVEGPPLPGTAPAQPAPDGPSFDVKQSGEFVNLTNFPGTLGGKLRLDAEQLPGGAHRLTGTVECVDGRSLDFDGTATPGAQAAVEGTLGGDRVRAQLRRDPPDPGSPRSRAPESIAGIYKLSPRSTCFGGKLELTGGDTTYGLEASERHLGSVSYDNDSGQLSAGSVECRRGGHVRFKAQAVDRNLNNITLIPLEVAKPATSAPDAPLTTPSGLPPSGEKMNGVKQRESFGLLVALFFLAAAVVMVAARFVGAAAVRIGQPRVMGEVVAGILLGPTLFGWLAPGLQAALFSSDVLPAFGVAANLGLIFYMFLIGLEVDTRQLRGRMTQAAAISNASVALPMILGIAVALPIYELVGPDTKFVAFALFMGVAMSITAFPVLGRILAERRMLKRPVGALTLTCAAIDDVTAWFLIALATAVATSGGGGDVLITILEAAAFTVLMLVLVRRVLARASTAFDEAGRVPGGWVAAIFAGVLLSAYATETIGIAVIFGAFIMGLIMPRNAGLTEDVTRRVEDYVITLLLPLFFAYTGLKTDIGLLDRPLLWGITVALIAVAIAGKLFGAMIAARVTAFDWRASAVIGTLMNTRGLTELIVLNLALEKGVISEALFAALVLMALFTTFMAGPMLKLLDPQNSYGAPVEEELEEARERSRAEFPQITVPERSILVAPQTDEALDPLKLLAEPLARSEPPRELIFARLVRPSRATDIRGGLQTENRLLRQATEEMTEARLELIDRGLAARAVAFSSPEPGRDLARLAKMEEVDLLLMNGARPLLGDGVPRGDVGDILEHAECDVAVLVAKEGSDVLPGAESGVIVPFGGAEHDWAALELGAWIASATQVPLRLLGASGQTDEAKSSSRLLADAGLLVQQYAGISAEPVLVEPGREGIVGAAADAGLLVIGLSERWRREGLGPVRSEIARAAPAPVVFVRRGHRPGALAPRTDVTRFTWSSAGVAQSLSGLSKA
jgi:Kef-type K+ transport system membrane component KefB